MPGDVEVKDNANTVHKINTDVLGDGGETQIVKLQLGNIGIDGGLVSADNPVPTNNKTVTDLYNIMAYFLDRLEFGMLTDNAKRLKVNLVESGALGTVITVGTVTTVSTVGTVNNQARIGDVQAQRVVEAQMDTAFNVGIVNHVSF